MCFFLLILINISQDWKFLKALFSIPGNKSLQHQMSNVDISKIPESNAIKARDIIELVDADMVRCTSSLAYDMYRWVSPFVLIEIGKNFKILWGSLLSLTL